MAIFERNKAAKNEDFAKSIQSLIEGVVSDAATKKHSAILQAITELKDIQLPPLVNLATEIKELKDSLADYIRLSAFDNIITEIKKSIDGDLDTNKETLQVVQKNLSDLSVELKNEISNAKGLVDKINIPSLEGYIKESDLEEYKNLVNEELSKTKIVRSGSGYAQILADGVKVARKNTINFRGSGVTVTNESNYTDVNITGGSGSPAGSDTQVQFNDGGAFGADADLTYNKTTNVLTVGGLVHTPVVQAHTSAGLLIEATGGGDVALFGAGGGQNATFYDGVKLDSQTASRILSTDGSKNITALDTTTYPSLTELSYVKGVTSSIQTQLAALTQQYEFISGIIETVADGSYILVVRVPYKGTISNTTTVSESGTCTAEFQINTTALGGTANSVSTTETTQTHSSANVFNTDDDIKLRVTSNSSCLKMSFTIRYVRTA